MKGVFLALLALVTLLTATGTAAEPLRVVASVPDLGSLAESVGGDLVSVQVLARGAQDPHFLEPRPSFIRKLHDADVFLVVGMDLESAWSPKLLQSARNPRVLPGAAGYIDASTAIRPLEVPRGAVNRARGDLHPYGNPHYLLDPLNGARVAGLLRNRFKALRPEQAESFDTGYERFVGALVEGLVGEALATSHPTDALVAAIERGDLDRLAGETPVGGWLGSVVRQPIVEDHGAWVYLAHRFGLSRVAILEPLPGIAPTTQHLGQVVSAARDADVTAVLSTAYLDPAPARFVAEHTGARVLPLAHQVGAREGADDYLSMCAYNARLLSQAP